MCRPCSEKAVAPHSSTLAWKIPWMEEPGRLQSMGSLRVGHDWATSLSLSCIGVGNGNPLQYSCLENPRDGGVWWAAVYGVTQSRTRLKQLSSSRSRRAIYLILRTSVLVLNLNYRGSIAVSKEKVQGKSQLWSEHLSKWPQRNLSKKSKKLQYWSGLPFPSPMHESEKWKWSRSVVSDSATPWTGAHQAPPSMGFSRQEYWSGLPFPSPGDLPNPMIEPQSPAL